jgi:hypothetical protein
MKKIYTNNYNLPFPLAIFLATDNYDFNDDPNTISATKLMKSVRKLVLAPRVPKADTVQDLMDQYSNRTGSAIHDGIENSIRNNRENALLSLGYSKSVIDRIEINPSPLYLKHNPNCIPIYLEVRHSKTINVDGVDYTITGKSDYIGEGVVEDYKNCKTYAYKKEDILKENQLQGSIYRWLNPTVITEDYMNVHQLFSDWMQGRTYGDDYPPHPIMSTKLSLLSLDYSEAYIIQKIRNVVKLHNAEDKDIPLCTKEDLWQDESTFKYYSNPDKTLKSTKNFSDKSKAYTHLQDKGKGVVKEVFAQAKACKYCPAFYVCEQKDDLIASGTLVLQR